MASLHSPLKSLEQRTILQENGNRLWHAPQSVIAYTLKGAGNPTDLTVYLDNKKPRYFSDIPREPTTENEGGDTARSVSFVSDDDVRNQYQPGALHPY